MVTLSWSARDFGPTYSILPAVTGTLLVTIGIQNVFGGFLLAIVGGNEARFLHEARFRHVEQVLSAAAE
jgi:hypothetical protein